MRRGREVRLCIVGELVAARGSCKLIGRAARAAFHCRRILWRTTMDRVSRCSLAAQFMWRTPTRHRQNFRARG